jgi:hypothetical protein
MALSVSFVSSVFWSSSTTSPVCANVTASTGSMVIGICLQNAPFAGRTVSSATWGANTATEFIDLVGSGGAPYDWMAAAAVLYEVTSGGTQSLTFNLSGGAAQGAIIALLATGHDSSSPISSTASNTTVAAIQMITCSGSSGDVAVYAVTDNQESADRWVETNSSTVQVYSNNPRPGTLGSSKLAVGIKTFSGANTTVGFTGRGFDAGPIDVDWEKLAIAFVIAQASGGATGSAAFFAYTRNSLTAGAI